MQDLRDAIRGLAAAPIVSAMAILSLALGIGANTAIFSILDSLILRTLPVRDPHQLAVASAGAAGRSWTNPQWEQIRDRRDLFAGAFAWSATRFNLSEAGQTQFVDGVWASGRYFDVLGVRPVLGRTFTEEDDRRRGGPDGPVAVISHSYWQRQFGGAADVVGRTITVERVPFTIVGVTGPEFFGTEVGRTFDVAIPLGTEPLIRGKESALDRRSTWWLNIMVRLTPAQTIESATAALRGVQPQIREATFPEHYRPQDKDRYLTDGFTLVAAGTGSSNLRTRYQQPLMTIMVVVALVLLIACANIANLLLARAAARRHEMSIRLALGASRLRLTRLLLVESLALSGAGAAAGLVFAYWGSRLLLRQLSTSTNTVFLPLALDWRVLGFTALIAIATAVLFGTAPALRATRVQPNDALKSQGRGIAGEGRFGLGNALVVVQVALSLTLIVAAGLFVRTFGSLNSLHLGFDRDPLMVVSVNMQPLQLEAGERRELTARLLEAVRAVPGVASAGTSQITPVSGSRWNNIIEVVGAPPMEERDRLSNMNSVSDDWFRTYGTRLLAGREFTPADRQGSAPVAVVNEAFARKFTGGENPVGRRIRMGGLGNAPPVEREIVGYAENAVYSSLREEVPPTIYLAEAQSSDGFPSVSITVRAAGGSPAPLARSVASAITAVSPRVALTFRPMAEQVGNSLVQERVVAMLAGFFGALALLLAGLGLYGVTSYAVSRRRTEIGIRMALGAAPAGVIRLVLVRVAALVGAGAVLGGALSLWLGGYVSTLLYGLQPRDPATLAGGALVLAAVGALAGFVPARRAARIDPARVLRT